MTNSLRLKMAIEIVDFPIENGGSFHSYVKLPEGNTFRQGIVWSLFIDLLWINSRESQGFASKNMLVPECSPPMVIWNHMIITLNNSIPWSWNTELCQPSMLKRICLKIGYTKIWYCIIIFLRQKRRYTWSSNTPKTYKVGSYPQYLHYPLSLVKLNPLLLKSPVFLTLTVPCVVKSSAMFHGSHPGPQAWKSAPMSWHHRAQSFWYIIYIYHTHYI